MEKLIRKFSKLGILSADDAHVALFFFWEHHEAYVIQSAWSGRDILTRSVFLYLLILIDTIYWNYGPNR